MAPLLTPVGIYRCRPSRSFSWPPCRRDTAKDNSCLDFEVVWDEVTAAIVVQYCQGATEAACTNQQLRSTNRGKTWTKTSIVNALGPDDGVLVRLAPILFAQLTQISQGFFRFGGSAPFLSPILPPPPWRERGAMLPHAAPARGCAPGAQAALRGSPC